MKYLFVAGLEHSGTTLLDHLLSQSPRVIGLGEVAQFFSVGHMKNYMAKWGDYPDVRLCSCGADWRECDFWSGIYPYSGLESDLPLTDKYKRLFAHVIDTGMGDRLVVDSSKNEASLQAVLPCLNDLGIDDFLVALVVKDVRSFVSSIGEKNGKGSLLATARSFNWWLGTNRRLLQTLKDNAIPFRVVLYERLCFDPDSYLDEILGYFRLESEQKVDLAHNNSHIAMGNKDFLFRNRERIKYDYRWFLKNRINLVYLAHQGARRFNESLYDL